MNKQLKIVAIVGALALIAGISVATLGEAQAQMLKPTHPDVKRMAPGMFGAKTSNIVCGDRLCNEPEFIIDIEEDTPIGIVSTDDSLAPTVSLISIDKFRASTAQENITYKLTFAVTAGETNLRNIEFVVKTDVGQYDYEIDSLNALKTSINVLRVKALDPDSINGELIGYSLTGPTGGDFR